MLRDEEIEELENQNFLVKDSLGMVFSKGAAVSAGMAISAEEPRPPVERTLQNKTDSERVIFLSNLLRKKKEYLSLVLRREHVRGQIQSNKIARLKAETAEKDSEYRLLQVKLNALTNVAYLTKAENIYNGVASEFRAAAVENMINMADLRIENAALQETIYEGKVINRELLSTLGEYHMTESDAKMRSNKMTSKILKIREMVSGLSECLGDLASLVGNFNTSLSRYMWEELAPAVGWGEQSESDSNPDVSSADQLETSEDNQLRIPSSFAEKVLPKVSRRRRSTATKRKKSFSQAPRPKADIMRIYTKTSTPTIVYKVPMEVTAELESLRNKDARKADLIKSLNDSIKQIITKLHAAEHALGKQPTQGKSDPTCVEVTNFDSGDFQNGAIAVSSDEFSLFSRSKALVGKERRSSSMRSTQQSKQRSLRLSSEFERLQLAQVECDIQASETQFDFSDLGLSTANYKKNFLTAPSVCDKGVGTEQFPSDDHQLAVREQPSDDRFPNGVEAHDGSFKILSSSVISYLHAKQKPPHSERPHTASCAEQICSICETPSVGSSSGEHIDWRQRRRPRRKCNSAQYNKNRSSLKKSDIPKSLVVLDPINNVTEQVQSMFCSNVLDSAQDLLRRARDLSSGSNSLRSVRPASAPIPSDFVKKKLTSSFTVSRLPPNCNFIK